jgi:hypothetical protein
MYGVGSASGACLSAFRFFFFPFFFSDAPPPWGELSGLVTVIGSFLRAATCAGVPLDEFEVASAAMGARLAAVNGDA